MHRDLSSTDENNVLLLKQLQNAVCFFFLFFLSAVQSGVESHTLSRGHPISDCSLCVCEWVNTTEESEEKPNYRNNVINRKEV